MKKLLSIVTATSLMLLMFTGCSSSSPSGEESTSKEEDTIKVAMVAAGVFGDQGMNDALLNGMNIFSEETGIKVNSVEISEFSDHAINARNFAEQGYDIILMGGPVSEVMPEIAEAYPDTHFILNKGTISDMDNVTSIQFDEAEPSFLGGAFAVLMSEELGGARQAGWVGGARIPDLEKARYAFVAGSEYVDGKTDVIYVGDFTDIAKSKEIALQMYNSGSKIVQGYAGAASTGVYQASESLDDTFYAMGSATGQFHLSPKIITSVIVKYDEAFAKMLIDYSETGVIESGVQVLGLQTDGSGLKYAPEFEETIPEEIKAQIEEIKEKIISGEIVVPTTEDEYNSFAK